MTAMPDSDQGYGTGETSIISKQNPPGLNIDADVHGTAATVPDDIETDPLTSADELVLCVNCEQSQWLSPDRTRCYYCATDQPAHRARRATVEHRRFGRIISVR